MEAPTFVKPCADELAHPPHLWEKFWEKAALPNLYHPERYPDTWRAQYSCPGVNSIAWNVETDHRDCRYCEAAADSAVGLALQNGTNEESWVDIELGPEENEVPHTAVATRI